MPRNPNRSPFDGAAPRPDEYNPAQDDWLDDDQKSQDRMMRMFRDVHKTHADDVLSDAERLAERREKWEQRESAYARELANVPDAELKGLIEELNRQAESRNDEIQLREMIDARDAHGDHGAKRSRLASVAKVDRDLIAKAKVARQILAERARGVHVAKSLPEAEDLSHADAYMSETVEGEMAPEEEATRFVSDIEARVRRKEALMREKARFESDTARLESLARDRAAGIEPLPEASIEQVTLKDLLDEQMGIKAELAITRWHQRARRRELQAKLDRIADEISHMQSSGANRMKMQENILRGEGILSARAVDGKKESVGVVSNRLKSETEHERAFFGGKTLDEDAKVSQRAKRAAEQKTLEAGTQGSFDPTSREVQSGRRELPQPEPSLWSRVTSLFRGRPSIDVQATNAALAEAGRERQTAKYVQGNVEPDWRHARSQKYRGTREVTAQEEQAAAVASLKEERRRRAHAVTEPARRVARAPESKSDVG